MPTTTSRLLIAGLFIWNVCLQSADGRYVKADDFTALTAEVATIKTERHAFNNMITGLEQKLNAWEAKFNMIEAKLSITENQLSETEKKLQIVETKFGNALSRIEDLEQALGFRQNQEEIKINNTYADDFEREMDGQSKLAPEPQTQRRDGIRQSYSAGLGHISKRIIPTATRKVAFSAYLQTTLTNLGIKHIIRFDTVPLNAGLGNISKRIVLTTTRPVATTTRQIAFSAYLYTPLTNLGRNHIIRFDGVPFNVDGVYDISLGAFKCPVAGVYMFQSAVMATGHSVIETNLVKDGSILVKMYADGSSTSHGFDQGFNSVITPCGVGEHVWVNVVTGTQIYGYQYTTFSGYLMWEN